MHTLIGAGQYTHQLAAKVLDSQRRRGRVIAEARVRTASERVEALVLGKRVDPWPIGQLASLGHEAKKRWLGTREQFGLDVCFAGDGVALLAPKFVLPDGMEERILAGLPGVDGRFAVRFLKWASCPKTMDSTNPLEPLIEILEHGGSSRPEHGMFLDIIDYQGATCGVVIYR
jgi:hypothetical protein